MAESDVNSEAQSESMPVLKSERPYGFKDYTVVITGLRARHGALSPEEVWRYM